LNQSPYPIVREFASSTSDKARAAAATALALSSDDDSLRELVAMGLTDTSDAVIKRVEDEVSSLSDVKKALVIGYLREALLKDGAERKKAYWLLGRLRGRGIRFRLTAIPFTRRLELARSLHTMPWPPGKRRFGLSVILPCLGGVVVTAFLFSLLLSMPAIGGSASDFWVAFVASAAVGLALSFVSMRSSSPVGMHPDYFAISMLDMGIAILSSALAAALFFFPTGEDVSQNQGLPLMIAMAAPCVRGEMLLTMGLFRGRFANRWFTILCGSAAGALVVTFVPILLHGQDNTGVSTAWLILVPLCAGFAAVFAEQDALCPPRTLVARPVGFAAALALAVVLILILFVTLRDAEPPPIPQPALASPVATGTQNLRFGPDSTSLRFHVDTAVQVSLAMGKVKAPCGWQISLGKPGNVFDINLSAAVRQRTATLAQGDYELKPVFSECRPAVDHLLEAFYKRLQAVKAGTSPPVECNVQLTFEGTVVPAAMAPRTVRKPDNVFQRLQGLLPEKSK
jgi:hypothetical protein